VKRPLNFWFLGTLREQADTGAGAAIPTTEPETQKAKVEGAQASSAAKPVEEVAVPPAEVPVEVKKEAKQEPKKVFTAVYSSVAYSKEYVLCSFRMRHLSPFHSRNRNPRSLPGLPVSKRRRQCNCQKSWKSHKRSLLSH